MLSLTRICPETIRVSYDGKPIGEIQGVPPNARYFGEKQQLVTRTLLTRINKEKS